MDKEKKQCQNCQNNFVIEPDDFAFYERIKVPPPTFCWKCRLVRRLVWRNERSLYKRVCNLCKKNIISMHKTELPFPVYCPDCWWGDNWSSLDYGRDYDFSKSFFEQFNDLQKAVPRIALYAADNVNSEYCNHTVHVKNCYLIFGSWFSEDCGYDQTVLECKDCWNCLFFNNCESCLNSFDCSKCYRTHFSQNCVGCTDSAFLYDCKNCQNCIFSFNLRSKNYYAFNKQVSKEEYERIRKEVFSSRSSLQKHLNEFRKMVRENALHKFYTGERNQNVSGDFIYNCKNVRNSYWIYDGENEKYAVRGTKTQKDSMDIFGLNAGELGYDSNNIDFSSRSFFSVNGENNMDTSYVVDSFNVEQLFGCISLKKKKYCILNKEYGEKEYKELKDKIIKHMADNPYVDKKGRVYRYGELFPIEISPFAYNETIAQEYFPITEEEANEMGYPWHIISEKGHVETMSWKDLPETIEEVDDSVLSEKILCRAWENDKQSAKEHGCTKAFRFTPNELSAHRKLGIPLPQECPNSRIFEISQLRNPVDFYNRKCECNGIKSKNGIYQNTISHKHHNDKPCPNEFQTSYSPDRPEIIYCEKCYQDEIV